MDQMSKRRALLFFFFQAEDGIRCLVRSRGLGDVYKRQLPPLRACGRRGGGIYLQAPGSATRFFFALRPEVSGARRDG